MSKRLVGFAIAGVIAIGFFAFYEFASRSGRGGESSPLYSARRHDPYGTAALADFLTERGVEVRYLERPRLDDADHGVLIQVLPLPRARPSKGPPGPPPPPVDRRLLDWIAKGNTVVQFTRGETELMDSFLRPPGAAESASVPGRGSGPEIVAWNEPDAREIEKYEAAGGLPDELPGSFQPADWTPAAAEILGLKGALPSADVAAFSALVEDRPAVRRASAGLLWRTRHRNGEPIRRGPRDLRRRPDAGAQQRAWTTAATSTSSSRSSGRTR